MKAVLEELQSAETGRNRLVGRLIFGALVLLAAAVGVVGRSVPCLFHRPSAGGRLESYRPSSVTEVYDDQGRVIGSFALQRRVVANYNDYPPILWQALISIEDKDFYRHWGVNVWRNLERSTAILSQVAEYKELRR